jgi:superfamily I DNA and/or RNA helicase
MNDWRRVNAAITRARQEGLIVIGNDKTLQAVTAGACG